MTNINLLSKPRIIQFDAVLAGKILFTEPGTKPLKYHAFVWSVEHHRFIWHEGTDLMGEKPQILHYEHMTSHPSLVIKIDHDELQTHRLYTGFKSWLVAAGAKV